MALRIRSLAPLPFLLLAGGCGSALRAGSVGAQVEIEGAAPIFVEAMPVRIVNPGGTGVLRYTLDGREPREDSPVYGSPFVVETTTTVRAAAFRGSRRSGDVVSAVFRRVPPIAAGQPRALAAGFEIEAFRGNWQQRPLFADLRPAAVWVAEWLDWPEGARPEDWDDSARAPSVGVRARGWVRAESRAVHRFRVRAADGVRLVVGDQAVIDADGCAPRRELEGFAPLDAGWHSILLESFGSLDAPVAELSWSAAGQPFVAVRAFHETR